MQMRPYQNMGVHAQLEDNLRLDAELDQLGRSLRRRGSLIMLVIAALIGSGVAIMLLSPPALLDSRGQAAAGALAPSLAISCLLLMFFALYEIHNINGMVRDATVVNRRAINNAIRHLGQMEAMGNRHDR